MKPSIVLDTPILTAALRSQKGASHRLFSLLGTKAFDLHLSIPLVIEYEDVLRQQQDTLPLSEKEIDQCIDYLCKIGIGHNGFFLWRPLLNDPADDMILELAVCARCSFIVTPNRRRFQRFEGFGIKAVTAPEFLQMIKVLP